MSIAEQLASGIRYLDLRVEPKDGTPWITHTMWSVPVSDVLNQVSDFVNQNPKEIVLLDFNHFYDMTPAIHAALAASIISMFGSKLAPNSVTTDVTVNELWENGQQVIVFYDDTETVNATQGKLWPESAISSPWPQTDDLNTLQTYLANELPNNSETFFVLQGVLTPTWSTEKDGLAAAVFSSNPASLHELATKVTPVVTSWIANGWWTQGLNIVIVDWPTVCPSFVATLWAINSGQMAAMAAEIAKLIANIQNPP